MSFNFNDARNLMVENQLRPNKIKNAAILDLFNRIKKEEFIFEGSKNLSYSDMDINITNNRGYIKNLSIAQLIQSSNITKKDKILHIGGLTGYVTVILSNLCKKLIVTEFNDEIIAILKKNINNLEIQNVDIFKSNFKDGYIDQSPYDLIFVDNPIKDLSTNLLNQLNINGKLIMLKKVDNAVCRAEKIIKYKDSYVNEYLFDVFTKYELYKEKTKFIF